MARFFKAIIMREVMDTHYVVVSDQGDQNTALVHVRIDSPSNNPDNLDEVRFEADYTLPEIDRLISALEGARNAVYLRAMQG